MTEEASRQGPPSAVRVRGAARSGPRVANRWIALVILSLAQLMVILDPTIVNIALPTAQHDLGFSTADRQWVVTGYALAFGSLLLLGGRLSDFFGRKRLFIIGVAGFAAASALGGAASGFEMLLTARVAQGAFAALLAPAALSMLSVTFADDRKERGRAFGIFGAISGAGGALGLLLGGLLTQDLSWRWCLYVNVIIAVIVLAGALAFLRDGARPTRTPLDIAGTVVVVLGLVGIVYGLGNAASKGWQDARTLGPVTAGVVLLIVFVLIEGRVSHPLLPLRVVLDRDRGAAYLSVGISGAGSFAVFLFLTYYLQETLGFTPLQTGLACLPLVGLVMVGAVISGAVLLPRTGPRPLIPAGCILAAAGLAMLTGLGARSSYAAGVLPSLRRGRVPHHRGDLGRQPRLARTARSDQGDETAARQRLRHPGDLVRPADEAGQLRPQVRAGAGGGRGRRGNLPAQYLQVNGPHFGSRVDADLVAEPAPQRLVRGEGIRLASSSGQRPHQQPGEFLIQRMLDDQRLQLAGAGGGPASLQFPRQEGDRRLQPQLLKAAGERLGEVPGIREGRAAPQRQGLRHLPLGDEPLESQRVHVVGRDRQPVSGRRLLNASRLAQCLAGPRDQGLQRVRHVGGERVVPDRLGQRAGAHRLPARQRQPGDQTAQSHAGDRHRRPAVVVDLKWSQDRDPHTSIVPAG